MGRRNRCPVCGGLKMDHARQCRKCYLAALARAMEIPGEGESS